jgi:hypothetical protein
MKEDRSYTLKETMAALIIIVVIIHLIWANTLSKGAHEEALRYISEHQLEIENRRYLTIIDFTKPSYVKRMYIFDLDSGKVLRYLVAHGKNSGYNYARDLSNEIGSHKSSRGFFITGEKYEGDHGSSLRLHGQEPGINDNAFRRDIVIHGADWVSYKAVLQNGGRLGRSWGCPAVPVSAAEEIIEKLKDGSLLYIYAQESVSGWKE